MCACACVCVSCGNEDGPRVASAEQILSHGAVTSLPSRWGRGDERGGKSASLVHARAGMCQSVVFLRRARFPLKKAASRTHRREDGERLFARIKYNVVELLYLCGSSVFSFTYYYAGVCPRRVARVFFSLLYSCPVSPDIFGPSGGSAGLKRRKFVCRPAISKKNSQLSTTERGGSRAASHKYTHTRSAAHRRRRVR